MIECTNFKSVESGALLGFVNLWVPKMGMEFYGCGYFKKNGHRWVSLPMKEYFNDAKERKYAPIVKFREKDHAEAFSKMAVEAIEAFLAANPVEKKGDAGGIPF